MANVPLKSITFPGLSDTYTIPQIDDTLAVAGKAADSKAAGDAIAGVLSGLSDLGQIVVGNTNDYATVLKPTSESHIDYDDLVTPGNYYCTTTSYASYLDNCPTAQGHKLIVFATTSNNRCFQLIIPNNDNHIYFRSNNSGTYRTWHVIGDKKETVSGSTPVIAAAEDMRYICGTVTSLSFTPCSSGTCEVRFTSGSSATSLTLPSGVKTPSGFNAASLSTNTIYNIKIVDGVYGSVEQWPST